MLKPLKIFLLIFPFILSASYAQITTPPPDDEEIPQEPEYTFEKPKSALSEKLHYGGNIWLGFFGAFYIDASPMAGIEVTDAGTVVGLGASFIYQGGFQQSGSFAAGPRFFVRQPVWRTIFVHAEYELMNADEERFYGFDPTVNRAPGVESQRKWGGSPLIGAGFYQNRDRQQKGSFISVMYNLGYSYNQGFISPQGLGGNSSPFVLRYGFFF
ncbi:hypothetical protein SAMN06298216_2599 [Spirosomataceae bacterium TFI 002]|nr:hypothetical protein SAMN06298216_2599 [Spirosomataceae bacterium TFI 002]